jgi:hypothetical protein
MTRSERAIWFALALIVAWNLMVFIALTRHLWAS